MAHIGAAAILSHARQHRYGIPCLLAGNLEMMLGALAAAEEARAPLILAYNSAVTPNIPMEIIIPAMVGAAVKADVPVATILDHGGDLGSVTRGIDLGLSTVMFDGSHLPYAENVRQTREVVQIAHAAGVDVEGELGAIGGSSVELGRDEAKSELTNPTMAAEFVEQTGVDIFAAAFGNAHGVYATDPQLDLERVRKIAAKVGAPLAMHGASGLADADYGSVIDAGISKINYYTAMARTATHDLRQRLDDATELDLVFHHVIDWTLEAFRAETRKLLTILRAAGQAENF